MESPEKAPHIVALRRKDQNDLSFSVTDKVHAVGSIPPEDLCLEVSSLKKKGFKNFWLLKYGARMLELLFGGSAGKFAVSKK